MKHKTNAPVPFDLSPLPEGFLRGVERGFYPATYGSNVIGLAWAIANVWERSTAKQRLAAEDGINAVLRAALAGDENVSHVVGIVGAKCTDLRMDFFDVSTIDAGSVLRGVWASGCVRVNDGLHDVIETLVYAL